MESSAHAVSSPTASRRPVGGSCRGPYVPPSQETIAHAMRTKENGERRLESTGGARESSNILESLYVRSRHIASAAARRHGLDRPSPWSVVRAGVRLRRPIRGAGGARRGGLSRAQRFQARALLDRRPRRADRRVGFSGGEVENGGEAQALVPG